MNIILWILITAFSVLVIVSTLGYYSILIFLVFVGGLIWENIKEQKQRKNMIELDQVRREIEKLLAKLKNE